MQDQMSYGQIIAKIPQVLPITSMQLPMVRQAPACAAVQSQVDTLFAKRRFMTVWVCWVGVHV